MAEEDMTIVGHKSAYFNETREADTFKLLIASDINLGYEETIKRRQFDDSFITFEEILQHALNEQVDAVLLAGNLFYSPKPSQVAMIKCTTLLKKYCLGTREVNIQVLADPHGSQNGDNFPINFEDPNVNIQLPIFCIHGNRDETLNGFAGPLDILSMSGLVNYFGQINDDENVHINPIILKKGKSIVSLYGMGNIHEQKAATLFEEEHVEFKIVNSLEGLENSFNILMINQARGKNSTDGNELKDNTFPNIFNLIVWGQEHECLIDPKKVLGKKYYITQPGSTIATSLTPAEAVEKCVGILHINKTEMKMQKIKLNTVRPFIFKQIVLRDHRIPKKFPRSDQVFNFLMEHIDSEIVPLAKSQLTGHKYQPMVPLVKVRVIYEDKKEICDTIKLCRQFCDDVANPMELLSWKKSNTNSATDYDVNMEDAWSGVAESDKWYLPVQDRLVKHFEDPAIREKLRVMTVKGLNHALTQFVEKEDNKAFNAVINFEIDNCIKHVASSEVSNDDTLIESINNFCTSRLEDEETTAKEIVDMLHGARRMKFINPISRDSYSTSRIDEQDFSNTSSAKGRGGTRGRQTSKTVIQATEKTSDNGLNITVTPSNKRGRASATNSKKIFDRPVHAQSEIPNAFDSQVDPLNMEDYHLDDW